VVYTIYEGWRREIGRGAEEGVDCEGGTKEAYYIAEIAEICIYVT
jgi:hypothetical protein